MKKITITFSLTLALLLGGLFHTEKAQAEFCDVITFECEQWCIGITPVGGSGFNYCEDYPTEGQQYIQRACACVVHNEHGFPLGEWPCPYAGNCAPAGGGSGGGTGGTVELPDLDEAGGPQSIWVGPPTLKKENQDLVY